MLQAKRVYEKKEESDGTRMLIDRLWPRGLTREQAAVDEWLRDLAPSDALRRWYGHRPQRWPEFRQRYIAELSAPQQAKLLEKVARMAASGDVTLVYAAKDTERNNATVLQELISELMENLP